jgi:hypothetical protein
LAADIITNPLTHLSTTGNLTWTATATPGNQFSFALETLLNPTPIGTDNPGLMDYFHARNTATAGPDDGDQAYAWPVITFAGTYTGPTDSVTLTADTLFDLSQFQNPHTGTFTMQFDGMNKSIDLVYTPSAVPEPGTLALAGMAAIGWVTFWRRRWQSNGPSATLSA